MSCSKLASTSTLQEAVGKSQHNAVYWSQYILTHLVTHMVIAQSCRKAVFDYELWQVTTLLAISPNCHANCQWQPITRYRPVRRITVKTDCVHCYLQLAASSKRQGCATAGLRILSTIWATWHLNRLAKTRRVSYSNPCLSLASSHLYFKHC